jgi:hypothetical protein
MLTALFVILRSIGLICRGHRAVALENLALRQQLAALTRTIKRPELRTRDRLFWILLSKAWPEWRTALIIVQPDTVVRWHRQWLRRQWALGSRRSCPGRPNTDVAVRTLVGTMAAANPLWGAPRIHGEFVQAGHRGIGADGVATPAATTSPAVTDVADLSHQSCRHARVDGLLHRANPHRPRAVRIGPAYPSAPANHPCQHHRTSHGCVDGATDD